MRVQEIAFQAIVAWLVWESESVWVDIGVCAT